MSKLLPFVTCLLIITITYGGEPIVFSGKKADKIVKGSELIRFKNFSSIPNYIKFKKGNEIPFSKLENWLNNFYKLDYQYGLLLINTEKDRLGYTHYRYCQTINGIPVRLSMVIVHVKDGVIESINGELFDKPVNAFNVSITSEDALNLALNDIQAEIYEWEIKEKMHLKSIEGISEVTYYPKADLVYINEGGKLHNKIKLAYKFNIYAYKPLSRQEIYVDAINGEILWSENKIHHVDELGTGQTAYSGVQTITSDNMGNATYRLQETGRGNGIRTFNCNNDTIFNNVDFTNSSENWNLLGIDAYAIDAHWGTEMTYDYYWNKHGRNSIDNNGYQLDSYVHYFINVENAFWDGSKMVYGDGFSNNNTTPFTTLDIIGHEVTHGLTSFTADLIYEAESGALNESFSDIFGTAVEYVARPTNANWLLADDINGVGYRDMSDPNVFENPDTYLGNFWHPIGWGGSDNDGVHTNSGVQNYWFYLLVDGGSGVNDNNATYLVNGLGLDTAAEIAYRNLTAYLTPSSQYYDARFYSIKATEDLFGECSSEVESVTNAWYAVGIGDAYEQGAFSNFEGCYVKSCEAPLTVEFLNNSQNGVSYLWNFGDGDTSTTYSPFHTYTGYGTFSVELIVEGSSACGNDTLIKTNYINIDSTTVCNTIMPNTGAVIITDCSGRLFDSGGPCSKYATDDNLQVLIQPPGSQQVSINFVTFDVEPGDQGGTICNYDNLKVYDGPSTLSSLIGTYCNNNLPPSIITSSGNSLTLVFESDIAVEYMGFEVEWSCVQSTLPPIADFVADVDTCSGEVNFIDMSSNGPANWLWNFGDGTFSNDQHPSHFYESGIYTVELVSTNSFGTSTETKIDDVYVNIPPSPTVQGDTICSDTTANLFASGQGTIRWYTNWNTISPIAYGNNYTTPVLIFSRTYYVDNVVEGPTQNLGKPDNTGSGEYNKGGTLIFEAFTGLFIKSVKIYAQSAGNITIKLIDEDWLSTPHSKTLYVNPGLQTVELNFLVEPGIYNMMNTSSDNVKLYRNKNFYGYPFTINGLVSITGSFSSYSGNHYNYFYDWEVKEPDCASPRVPVVAEVSSCVGIGEINSISNILSYFNSTTDNIEIKFNNVSKGAYDLNIFNNIGQNIYEDILNISENGNTEVVNMEGRPKGLYVLILKNKYGFYSKKIIK